MSKATQSHYEAHSAASYESAYFYSPGAYTDYLSEIVQKRLGLEPTTKRRLLDIGGGTGNFTRMLIRNSPDVEAIVIDPFLESTSDSTQQAKDAVKFVKAGAESFVERDETAWWRKDYDQVLLKEVVHHLEAEDRAKMAAQIYEELPEKPSSDPSVLLVTRPQFEIDYPLWKEAQEVWAENQPGLLDLKSELEEAGFSQVSSSVEAYPCEINIDAWTKMVKNRFWSTFSNFSDAELDEACQRIRSEHADRIDADGTINFEDRLLFISAYK